MNLPSLPKTGTVLALWILLAASAYAQQNRTLRTEHYDIHTDLPEDTLREAALRSTWMEREYSNRTAKMFKRQLTARLPLYLFSKQADYQRAGALPGSAGTFVVDEDGDGRLLVLVGERATESTWRTMQHEGFHQFVHSVIGGRIPIWLNEGLAEYFGDGLYTGDDYITGVVHPAKLRQLKRMIDDKELRPLREMMLTRHEEWNSNLSAANYIQAWSMVHFLAHADAKYERAFNTFIYNVSQGSPWEREWAAQFGSDIGPFERRWREYWLKLDPESGEELYRKAVVATMTSHLGRAVAQGQKFADAAAFFEAARGGALKQHRDDWLPPSLLERDLPLVDAVGEWSLGANGRQLVCKVSPRMTLIGEFETRGARIRNDSVRVTARKAR